MDTETIPRRFDFARDRFAFANELVWEYQLDAVTGKMNYRPHTPRPDYAHRCFVLTRAARQFLYHARFDATQTAVAAETYRQRLKQVLARNPRVCSPPAAQVVFPGYASLYEFSGPWEKLLKAECGGAWRSYVLRSHWRMVFPISRAHQVQTAAGLVTRLEAGRSPIIHLVTFPSLTINHSMVVIAAAPSQAGVDFSAYDPNQPAQPVTLSFDRVKQTFSLPENRYWAGGRLNVIEIYRSWLM
jgi:hypothetical protein